MDKQPTPDSMLITFAEELGGTDIEVTVDGSVDFYLGPIPAFAYLRRGTRASGQAS